jgi:hypothetical protein
MTIPKDSNIRVLQYYSFRIHRVAWRHYFYYKFTFKIEVAYYTSQITQIKKRTDGISTISAINRMMCYPRWR